MSKGSNQDDVGIARVDDDRAYVTRVLQADVGPGASGVGGLVHSVAVRNVAAEAGFAAAGVKNIGIRIRHCNRANGRNALMIEHRRPCHTAVGALEDTSGNRAEIVGIGIARDASNREYSATAERPNLPPFHAANKGGTDLRQSASGKTRTHQRSNYNPTSHLRWASFTGSRVIVKETMRRCKTRGAVVSGKNRR